MAKQTNKGQIAGFVTAHEKLATITKRLVAISERNIGLVHTGRQRRALFIFSKLIAHNLGIIGLGDRFRESPTDMLLDHFSAAVLERQAN